MRELQALVNGADAPGAAAAVQVGEQTALC